MLKWNFLIGVTISLNLVDAKREWPIQNQPNKEGYSVKVISEDPLIYRLELPNNQTQATHKRSNIDRPERPNRFLEPEVNGKNLTKGFVRKRRCHHRQPHLKMKRNTPSVETDDNVKETTEISEVTAIYEEMNYLPKMAPYNYKLLDKTDHPAPHIDNKRSSQHQDNIDSSDFPVTHKNHVTPREAPPYEPQTIHSNSQTPESSAEAYKIIDMSQPNLKEFQTLKQYLQKVHERQLESHQNQYRDKIDNDKSPRYLENTELSRRDGYYPEVNTPWTKRNEAAVRETYYPRHGENYINDDTTILPYKSPYYNGNVDAQKSRETPRMNENSQVYTSELQHLHPEIQQYLDPKKLYLEALNSLISRHIPEISNKSANAQGRKSPKNSNKPLNQENVNEHSSVRNTNETVKIFKTIDPNVVKENNHYGPRIDSRSSHISPVQNYGTGNTNQESRSSSSNTGMMQAPNVAVNRYQNSNSPTVVTEPKYASELNLTNARTLPEQKAPLTFSSDSKTSILPESIGESYNQDPRKFSNVDRAIESTSGVKNFQNINRISSPGLQNIANLSSQMKTYKPTQTVNSPRTDSVQELNSAVKSYQHLPRINFPGYENIAETNHGMNINQQDTPIDNGTKGIAESISEMKGNDPSNSISSLVMSELNPAVKNYQPLPKINSPGFENVALSNYGSNIKQPDSIINNGIKGLAESIPEIKSYENSYSQSMPGTNKMLELNPTVKNYQPLPWLNSPDFENIAETNHGINMKQLGTPNIEHINPTINSDGFKGIPEPIHEKESNPNDKNISKLNAVVQKLEQLKKVSTLSKNYQPLSTIGSRDVETSVPAIISSVHGLNQGGKYLMNLRNSQTLEEPYFKIPTKKHEMIQQGSYLTPKEIEFYKEPSPSVLLMDHIPAITPDANKGTLNLGNPLSPEGFVASENKFDPRERSKLVNGNFPLAQQSLNPKVTFGEQKEEPINRLQPSSQHTSEVFIPPTVDQSKIQPHTGMNTPPYNVISNKQDVIDNGKSELPSIQSPPYGYSDIISPTASDANQQVETLNAIHDKQLEMLPSFPTQDVSVVPIEANPEIPTDSKQIQPQHNITVNKSPLVENNLQTKKIGEVNAPTKIIKIAKSENSKQASLVFNNSSNPAQTSDIDIRLPPKFEENGDRIAVSERTSLEKIIINTDTPKDSSLNHQLKETNYLVSSTKENKTRLNKGKPARRYLSRTSTIPEPVQKFLLRYFPKDRQPVTPEPLYTAQNTTEPMQERESKVSPQVLTMQQNQTATLDKVESVEDKQKNSQHTTTAKPKTIMKIRNKVKIPKLYPIATKQEILSAHSQKISKTSGINNQNLSSDNKTEINLLNGEENKGLPDKIRNESKIENQGSPRKITNDSITIQTDGTNISTASADRSLDKAVANEILELQKTYLQNLPQNLQNHGYGFYHVNTLDRQNKTDTPYNLILEENKKLAQSETNEKELNAEYPIQFLKDHIKTAEPYQIVEEQPKLKEVNAPETTTESPDYNILYDGENTSSSEDKIKSIVSLIRNLSKKNESEVKEKDHNLALSKELMISENKNIGPKSVIQKSEGIAGVTPTNETKNYLETDLKLENNQNRKDLADPLNTPLPIIENIEESTKEAPKGILNNKDKETKTPMDSMVKLTNSQPSTTEISKTKKINNSKLESVSPRKSQSKSQNLESIMEQLKKIIIPFDPNSPQRKIIFIDPNKFNQKVLKVIEIPDNKQNISEVSMPSNQFDPFENDQLAKSSPDTDSSENDENSEASYEDEEGTEEDASVEGGDGTQRRVLPNVSRKILGEDKKNDTELNNSKISPSKLQFPDIKEQIKWLSYPNSGTKMGNYDRFISQRSAIQTPSSNRTDSSFLSSRQNKALSALQVKLAQQKEERRLAAENRSKAFKELLQQSDLKESTKFMSSTETPFNFSTSNSNGEPVGGFPIGSVHIHNSNDSPIDATDPAFFGYNPNKKLPSAKKNLFPPLGDVNDLNDQSLNVQKRSCLCGSQNGVMIANTCNCGLQNSQKENNIKIANKSSSINSNISNLQARIANQRKLFNSNKNLKTSTDISVLENPKKPTKCSLCKDCSSASAESGDVDLSKSHSGCGCHHDEIHLIKVNSDKLKAVKPIQNSCGCGKLGIGGCNHNELLGAAASPKDDTNKYDILSNVLLYLKQYAPEENKILKS